MYLSVLGTLEIFRAKMSSLSGHSNTIEKPPDAATTSVLYFTGIDAVSIYTRSPPARYQFYNQPSSLYTHSIQFPGTVFLIHDNSHSLLHIAIGV